jgi:hypothetical protein
MNEKYNPDFPNPNMASMIDKIARKYAYTLPLRVMHYVGATGEPSFQGGWVNWAGGYRTLRFWIDALGLVHIEGFIKNGSGKIFTLPAEGGFRPTMTQRPGTTLVESSVRYAGNIQVLTNGDVYAFGTGTLNDEVSVYIIYDPKE